jgi:AraC-like DNA-binding protein
MKIHYELNLNHDREWQMQCHHFHENYEILLSLSDAGSIFLEKTLYPLNRGTLLFIKDTVLHRTIAAECESYSRYVLHFEKDTLKTISTAQSDFLSHFVSDSRCIQLSEAELSELAAHFEKCNTPSTNAFGDDLRKSMAFVDLLIHTHQLMKTKHQAASSQNEDFGKVVPILEYIQQNLNEPLSLDQISQHFFINKYHLCHMFKSTTGFSVGEYVIHNRIMKSRALLRSGCSVQAAGEMSGFQNNAHFIRTFGKLSGVSPGKYRKEFLQNATKS